MTRKEFIINTCSTCLAAAGVSSLISSCATTQNVRGKLVNDGLIIGTDEFLVSKKANSAYRSFIIVRSDALKYPICIYRFGEKEYSALWMRCTHQGAELQASGDMLQCPAHGSEFDNRGQVTSGPAGESLRSFPVTISNNELFIDLRKQS